MTNIIGNQEQRKSRINTEKWKEHKEYYINKENLKKKAVEKLEEKTKYEGDTPYGNMSGYVYVPKINLYVSKTLTLFGQDMETCCHELEQNQHRMIYLDEFVEFLRYLKSDKKSKENIKLYEEITGQRDPVRGEWIDAVFDVTQGEMYIHKNYYSNKRYHKTEALKEGTFIGDMSVGMSLADYISKNHTTQGLPNKNVARGKVCFAFPSVSPDYATQFYTGATVTILNCRVERITQSKVIGVRPVKPAN